MKHLKINNLETAVPYYSIDYAEQNISCFTSIAGIDISHSFEIEETETNFLRRNEMNNWTEKRLLNTRSFISIEVWQLFKIIR